MSAPLTLSAEFRKLVEARMDQVLKGIEVTFNEIIEKQKITPTELKDELESLEESFNFLFQKWSLEILYTLMLKDAIGFGGIKKILTVNSRTLSDKLKMLQKHGYITQKRHSWTASASGVRFDSEGKKHCASCFAFAVLFQFSLTYGFGWVFLNVWGRLVDSFTVSKTMQVNVLSKPLINRNLSTTNLPTASTFSARNFTSKSQSPVIMWTSWTSGNRAISSATCLWEMGVSSSFFAL